MRQTPDSIDVKLFSRGSGISQSFIAVILCFFFWVYGLIWVAMLDLRVEKK